MDDSASTHKRRKLIKTNKNVPPRKQTVVAEVSRATFSKKKKNGIKWSRKMDTDVSTPQSKGERRDRQREREREIYHTVLIHCYR